MGVGVAVGKGIAWVAVGAGVRVGAWVRVGAGDIVEVAGAVGARADSGVDAGVGVGSSPQAASPMAEINKAGIRSLNPFLLRPSVMHRQYDRLAKARPKSRRL